MSRIKFVCALCIGLIIYLSLSVLVGRNGLWPYRQLEEQKYLLSKNIHVLSGINDDLTWDYQALSGDEAKIKAYARKLGYVCDGEVLVKVTGMSDYELKVYNPGNVVRLGSIQYVSERGCKVLGISFFGLACLLFWIGGLRHRSGARNVISFERGAGENPERYSRTQVTEMERRS